MGWEEEEWGGLYGDAGNRFSEAPQGHPAEAREERVGAERVRSPLPAGHSHSTLARWSAEQHRLSYNTEHTNWFRDLWWLPPQPRVGRLADIRVG